MKRRPPTECEVCHSTDTSWTAHPGHHLDCNNCGHREKQAGVPEHLRSA